MTCGISSTRKPCGREKVGDRRKAGGPRKQVIFGTDSTPYIRKYIYLHVAQYSQEEKHHDDEERQNLMMIYQDEQEEEVAGHAMYRSELEEKFVPF